MHVPFLTDFSWCRTRTHMSCSKGLSQSLKEDRISQLPDPLWRTLWLWVPNLELSSSKFPCFNAFLSFGNLFFDSDRASCVESLKLYLDGNDASYLKPWVDALVKRKI
ncbi:hypothetical protein AtEden1_Chr2g0226471 [Arabidopsis thaliana]